MTPTMGSLLAPFLGSSLLGELSNFKMNPIKSEILTISLSKKEALALQSEFPFIWEGKELKYLGIKLNASLGKLYQANFIPLLNEIKTEMKKLSTRPVSWMGSINMLKMVILPKIVYKFQMIPIKLPQAFFFRTIKTMILRYIWQGKNPRVQYAILSRGKMHQI